MAGRPLGKGNGKPCAGELANGQACNSRAWKDGGLCLHCSDKQAALLASHYEALEEPELMKVTVVLPAIGDLRYATREELFGIALYLREVCPNATNPVARSV
jgi:hypothetical protein